MSTIDPGPYWVKTIHGDEFSGMEITRFPGYDVRLFLSDGEVWVPIDNVVMMRKGPSGFDRSERNLARFSVADLDTVLGRNATEDEIDSMTKTLSHSSMGEVFQECAMVTIDFENEG